MHELYLLYLLDKTLSTITKQEERKSRTMRHGISWNSEGEMLYFHFRKI